MIERILVSGVILSAVYGLLAFGFSLIYGAARIINLAHTALFMVAAYILFTFVQQLGASLFVSIAVTMLAVTALGVVVYKAIIERIREHEQTVFMITLALALVLQQAIILIYSAVFRGVETFIPGFVEIIGVRVSNQHILAVAVAAICVVAMAGFLYRTRIGLAVRITAQDREIANVVGINVGTMCIIAVALATALAAVAGIVVAPFYSVEPRMWLHPLIIILAVVILGGLGSIRGSIIGALILGFSESVIANVLPMGSFLRGAFALAIVLAVLLIKPEGLFGVTYEQERL